MPATSPFYPHEFARAFGIDGTPLNVYWSAIELGPRTIAPTTEQWNVVAGVRGVAMGWTYNGAFNYSRSDVDQRATDGYMRESALLPILNSGVVNPFGPNTPSIVDLMSTAKFDGTLRTGTSSTTSLDFIASNEVLALPSGPVSVAIGLSARREELTQTSDPALASGDVLNLSATPSLSGSRNILALFGEANVPLVRTLEANVAVRYDHYSDFGGTTNPQVSLRWQPTPTLLLRASAGTGFFAPALAGLFQPPIYGITPGNLSDPARCPVTHSPQDCNTQFPLLGGGNPALQPTTSKQWSVGGVWAPDTGALAGTRLRLDPARRPHQFLHRPADLCAVSQWRHRPDVLPDPSRAGRSRVSDSSGADRPSRPVPHQPWQAEGHRHRLHLAVPRAETGLGSVQAELHRNLQHRESRASNSTEATPTRSITIPLVGGNPGVIPYWHHYLVLDWNYGPWSVTVTENYQTGGYDQSPAPGTGTQLRTIGDYDLWNVGFAYAGFRNWTLSAGIKNLFDRDPPFSNQTQNFQVGYDPTYGDPHGRLYWAGVRYAFR